MTAFRIRTWPAALAGAAAFAGLAGCGGEDVVKDEPTPVPPTAADPVQPQPSSMTPGAPPVGDDSSGERGRNHPEDSGEHGEGGNRGPG